MLNQCCNNRNKAKQFRNHKKNGLLSHQPEMDAVLKSLSSATECDWVCCGECGVQDKCSTIRVHEVKDCSCVISASVLSSCSAVCVTAAKQNHQLHLPPVCSSPAPACDQSLLPRSVFPHPSLHFVTSQRTTCKTVICIILMMLYCAGGRRKRITED